MTPGTKVVYVGGECDICKIVIDNYPPELYNPETDLKEGRVYTVEEFWQVEIYGVIGYGVRVVEYTLPPLWGHCSCGFREIDGDAEEWKQMMHNHKSKTRELESA